MLTMTPYFIQPMLQLWQVDHCFLCTILVAYTALVLAGKAEGWLAGWLAFISCKALLFRWLFVLFCPRGHQAEIRYWRRQRSLSKSKASPEQSLKKRKVKVKSRFGYVLKNSHFPKKNLKKLSTRRSRNKVFHPLCTSASRQLLLTPCSLDFCPAASVCALLLSPNALDVINNFWVCGKDLESNVVPG